MRIEKLLYNPKVIIAKDGDKTFLIDRFNMSFSEPFLGESKILCIWRDGEIKEMHCEKRVSVALGYSYVFMGEKQ